MCFLSSPSTLQKGNRGMQNASLIYSLSHPQRKHEWLGAHCLPARLSDPHTVVWLLFCFLRKRSLTNGPPMTRRITGRFLLLSSLLNAPNRNIDILTDLWLFRHQWWSEDMLMHVCEDSWGGVWNLESHEGSWGAMAGLWWWIVESHVDLGKTERLESHDASPSS